MQEIAAGIFLEQHLRGVTLGAIQTSAGYVLIDTPAFPSDANYWLDTLKRHKNLPVAAIILLDAHRDRLLGASWFNPPMIIAHAMTFDSVKTLSGSYVSSIANLLGTNNIERKQLLSGRILQPTITFTERMRLHFGNTTIYIEHRPGPTNGSIWVHVPSRNVLFVGDSLIKGEPPYLTSPYSAAWLDALELLEEMDEKIILGGRSGIATLEAIPPLRAYLTLARDEIKQLYENRRPFSEMNTLIHRLMEIYPPPLENDLDEIQQRVRTGLQFIYNEFRKEDLALRGEEDSTFMQNP